MMNFVTKKVVMFAGLLAVPALSTAESGTSQAAMPQPSDPRLPALKAFFNKYRCPVGHWAQEFLLASDENNLDWRLLPSISLVESGGGKQFKKNNIFGWKSATGEFPSIRAAIHTVASRLKNSKLYKNKDLDGILRTYNPLPEYSYRVKSVMRGIGSADLGLNAALN